MSNHGPSYDINLMYLLKGSSLSIRYCGEHRGQGWINIENQHAFLYSQAPNNSPTHPSFADSVTPEWGTENSCFTSILALYTSIWVFTPNKHVRQRDTSSVDGSLLTPPCSAHNEIEPLNTTSQCSFQRLFCTTRLFILRVGSSSMRTSKEHRSHSQLNKAELVKLACSK